MPATAPRRGELGYYPGRGVPDVLVSRLPAGAVATEPQILRERAIDSWALALLRQVRGDDLPIPKAVIFPTRTQDVATVLAWASKTRTAVIPRGAGSGVCGGAQAHQGPVVLDLSRLNKVTGLDLISRTVDVQAGLRGDQLEDALAAEGLTVGHYPQSAAISTVGGWIAASSAGQASAGFGAIEDVLLVQAETGAAIVRGYDETDAALSFGALGHPGAAAWRSPRPPHRTTAPWTCSSWPGRRPTHRGWSAGSGGRARPRR